MVRTHIHGAIAGERVVVRHPHAGQGRHGRAIAGEGHRVAAERRPVADRHGSRIDRCPAGVGVGCAENQSARSALNQRATVADHARVGQRDCSIGDTDASVARSKIDPAVHRRVGRAGIVQRAAVGQDDRGVGADPAAGARVGQIGYLERASADRCRSSVGVETREHQGACARLGQAAGARDHAGVGEVIGTVEGQGAVVGDVAAAEASVRATVAYLERACADRDEGGIQRAIDRPSPGGLLGEPTGEGRRAGDRTGEQGRPCAVESQEGIRVGPHVQRATDHAPGEEGDGVVAAGHLDTAIDHAAAQVDQRVGVAGKTHAQSDAGTRSI